MGPTHMSPSTLDEQLARLRADLRRPRPGGRRLLRRRRLLPPGGGRPPGARPVGPGGDGHVAGRPGRGGRPGRRRWPPSSGSVGGRWRRRSWPAPGTWPTPATAATTAAASCSTCWPRSPPPRAPGWRWPSATIVDDLSDHRPGQRAAAERGVRTPLADAGFTKADVRAAARRLGLAVWDKPAAACLASRIPYGTPVTIGTLDRVGRAEAAVRALGFADLRVRHYGDLARLEVPLADLARVLERRAEVVAAVVARRVPLCDARPGRATVGQPQLGSGEMIESSKSRLHLSFPEPLVERPVIYEAANRFGVVPNIRRANVETHYRLGDPRAHRRPAVHRRGRDLVLGGGRHREPHGG